MFPDPQARSKSHPPNFLLLCVWELKGIEQAEYARFTKHRRYIIKSTLHGIIQAGLFLKSMKFLCEKNLNSALFGVKPKF